MRRVGWSMGGAAVATLLVAGTAAAQQSAPAEGMDERCSVAETIHFGSGATSLDEAGQEAVQRMASWLEQDDRRFVRVEGHADPSGSPALNERLSERRAQAVESKLHAMGIDRGRVRTFGRGEEMAPMTMASGSASPEDMRVVVISACERTTTAQTPSPAAPTPTPPTTSDPAPGAPAPTVAEPSTAAPSPAPAAPTPDPSAIAQGPTETPAETPAETMDETMPAEELPPAPPPGPMVGETPPTIAAEPTDEELLPASRIGVGLTVGGGVTGLVDEEARGLTDPGGSWEARAVFGTRLPLALELAYVGSAQNLEVAGLDEDALLVGNGGEANLRLQLPFGMFRPYVFAGIGWTHYEIGQDDALGTTLRDDDDIGTVPFGVGIALVQFRGFTADLRGTGRAVFSDDLLDGAAPAGKEAQLHSWGVSAQVGAEF